MLEHLLGDPQLAQREAAQLAPRGQRHRQRQRPRRQRAREALVERHREAGGVRRGRQLVDQLVDALPARVGEVEGAAVEVGLVHQVLHRARHPVDRHDVRAPEVQPHQRQPFRQQPPRALDRLEEVVRPVDLVHLAGARVADDDRRPVHPPRHERLLAHDPLGLPLRAVVGRGQLLALVEHLLAERRPCKRPPRRSRRRGAGTPPPASAPARPRASCRRRSRRVFCSAGAVMS